MSREKFENIKTSKCIQLCCPLRNSFFFLEQRLKISNPSRMFTMLNWTPKLFFRIINIFFIQQTDINFNYISSFHCVNHLEPLEFMTKDSNSLASWCHICYNHLSFFTRLNCDYKFLPCFINNWIVNYPDKQTWN